MPQSKNLPSPSPLHVVVLMPLRDDWASVSELVRRLDQTISSYPCSLEILIVDDGSVHLYNSEDFQSDFVVVRAIQVLRLRRNLGHQRAIAVGLVHINQSIPCSAVLVMDSDGEDTAAGALELIDAFSVSGREVKRKAIFAERSRRTESFIFRFFYSVYKIVHRVLTGISVRVGNFSILGFDDVNRLVVMSELWNHYAAAYFRSGLPFTTTPIPRGRRIAGKSRMNFISLAAHGISAMSVFGDVVGVRLLIASIAGALLVSFGILSVFIVRFFTGFAIPGWATYAIGILVIILIQFVTIAISFTFIVLSSRINLNFVPLRDCSVFVDEIMDVYRNE